MRDIGIGIIGWGFMGKTHAHALSDMALFYPGMGFRPVLQSVCAKHLENALSAQEACGFAQATDDYRAVLDNPQVDVVSISTPNEQHLQMALDALHAGKHVYIDKPLALNAHEAREILAAVNQSGRLLQVAQNNRFFPSTMRARQLIEAGKLGKILSFRFDYLHSGSVDPDRPVGWKQLPQGGVLLDLASHAVDLLYFLVGDVDEVMCEARTLYASRPTKAGERVNALAEDQVVALIRLQNGALGTLEASKIATGTEDELSFSIHGTKGALRWNLMQADYLDYFDGEAADQPLGGTHGFTRIACVQRYAHPAGQFLPGKSTIGWDRAHRHSYYCFLEAVATGAAVSPDVREALRVQEILDGMRLAQKARNWVRV
ncbi:MAG: Gfo/Idh/MocA family oxidoreductase [Clostridia bacterium]